MMDKLPEELILHIINHDDSRFSILRKLYNVNSKYRNMIKNGIINYRGIDLSKIFENVTEENYIMFLMSKNKTIELLKNYNTIIHIIYNNIKKSLLWRSNAYLVLYHIRNKLINLCGYNILYIYKFEENIKYISNYDKYIINIVNIFRERYSVFDQDLDEYLLDRKVAITILQGYFRRMLQNQCLELPNHT